MPYVGRDLQRGNYVKLDDISSSFDGSVTTFNLTLGNSAFYPGSPFAILVSLGGIIQEPESAYTINQSQITFAAAPHNVDNCFIIALGLSLGIGVPGHGTVDGDQLAKPLNYNTGDLYLDSTNNRIGVGNTSPQYRLDVTGDANVSGNLSVGGTVTYQDVTSIDSVGIITAQTGIHLGIGATAGKFDASTGISTFSSAVGIADSIFHVGDTDTSLRFPAADTITAGTAGIERLRITSDGRIGMHDSTPNDYELDINKRSTATDANMRLYNNATGSSNDTILRLHIAGTSANNYIYFGDGDDSNAGQIVYTHNVDAMRFWINTEERLRIDSVGKVGIGTEGPETNLTIAKNATNQTVATIPTVRLTNLDTTAVATDIVGSYEFFSKDAHSENKVTGFMRNTPTDAGVNYDLTFGTIKTSDSNAVERLRITGIGSVGIGTIAPESLLSLYSEAAGAELLHFDMGSADARRGWKFLQHDTGTATDLHLQADDNGKYFAICNSGGTEQFEVYTSTTADDAFVRITPQVSIGSTIVHSEDTDTSIGFPAANTFAVETAGSERLRIASSGILLIGTDSSRQTRVGGSNFQGLVQVESDSELGYTLSRFNNSTGGPRLVLQKARGTGAGTSIVHEDDQVGQLLFSGWDGDTFSNLAQINVEVDGEPGDDDMPGRMIFETTADEPSGAYQTTERLRINSTGQLELRKNQNSVTGRPENRIVFRDLDSSVAAEQPIGEISWYSNDAGMTNVNSWIRGINEATNGAGALLFGVKDAGEDEIEALRITHDGLVGIGTPVPDAKLEVYNGGIKIDRKDAGGTSNPHLNMITGETGLSRLMIYAEDYTDNNSNWIYKTNSNEEHSFVVAATEILRLRSNSVGIGQSVPTARLQVAGSSPYAVTDSGRAVEGIDITGTAGGNGNYGAAISFGAGATGRAAITAVQNATDADNVGLAIITHPTGTGANDGVEKIRIHSSGRIGIGTDNMDTSADVSITNDTSSARIYMKSADDSDCSIYFGSINDSATGAIRYDHSDDTLRLYGYNNSQKLVISSDGEIQCTGAADDKGFAVYLDTTRRVAEMIEHSSDGEIRLYTGESTPVLRTVLTSYGNSYIHAAGTGDVGIGTAIPSGKLNIVTSASNALNIMQDSGDLSIRLNDRGSSSAYIKLPDGSGELSFEANGGERLRLLSTGGISIPANTNGTGTIQLQDNKIGGHRIAVSQDTISAAIYMPRKGCIVAITAFTTYDTYPQPGSSGLAYLDMGPSRRVDVMYTVNEDASGSSPVSTSSSGLQGKGAYSGTIGDCTDGKTTLMAGNTEGTFRIVNRTSNDYTYTITFL